jgi:hypothetical protein
MNKGTRLMAFAEAAVCLQDVVDNATRASELLRAVGDFKEAERMERGVSGFLEPMRARCAEEHYRLWSERLSEWQVPK